MVRPKVLLIDPDITVRKELEVTAKGRIRHVGDGRPGHSGDTMS